MITNKLVIIRHGESEWNKENRFTGWTDIDLSDEGRIEAKKAGHNIKMEGLLFDVAYTSLLKRAIHTLWIVLDEIDQAWLLVNKSWRLNERHYGALQGLNKEETAKKYGPEKVKQWRRSFSICPPRLTKEDNRFPGRDIRYAHINDNDLPTTESLAMTIQRITPYWENNIFPCIKDGKRVLIVAHGNSLRALIKIIEQLTEEEIFLLNIPTGVPIVYDFDNNMKYKKHYYLID